MDYDPSQIGDIIAQQQALARRQALLDTLQKNNLSTGIQGTHGGLQAALKAITGVLLTQGGDKIAKQQSDAQGAYSTGLQGATAQIASALQGSPAREFAGPPDESGTGPGGIPAVAPDRMKAVLSAMSSRYPELQAFGKQELSNIGKGEAETFGNAVTETDPSTKQPIQVVYGNRGTRRVVPNALPDQKNIAIGSKLVSERSGAQVADLGDQYGPVEILYHDPNGNPVRGQRNLQDNKLAMLSNGQTINVGAQVNKAGAEELFKSAVKTTSDLGEAARGAADLRGTLTQLQALDKAGTFSGTGVSPTIWLNNLAKTAGLQVDSATLANSQNYQSISQQAVQALIAKAGGNRAITAPEQEMIAKIIPQLSASQEARMQLTRILDNGAQRSISQYRSAQKSLREAYRADDPSKFDYLSSTGDPIAPSEPVVPAGGNKPTIVNW